VTRVPGSRGLPISTAAAGAMVCLAAAIASGCDAGTTKELGSDYPAASCEMTPVDAPNPTDPFYEKYLDANGIPVLASAAVSDQAVKTACIVIVRMLSRRDDVRQAMIGQQMHFVVIGRNEKTTDMPDYRNLYALFPNGDWDNQRGVGATLMIPASSAGEENLLCLQDDRFRGEMILVQTFATAVLLGVEQVDSTFDTRLRDAYDAGVRNGGLWRDTYAAINQIEYYAEGVQDWFDANPNVSPPDGTHNEINTRAELRAYDPALAALVQETMPDDAWRPKCP
jgi:hypothetical protein